MYSCKVEEFCRIFDEEGSFWRKVKNTVSVNVGTDKSYEPLSVMLTDIAKDNTAFGKVNLLFEYRLVDHKGFCDLVIIGKKENIPCVYIVELKEWKSGRICVPFKDALGEKKKRKILYNGDNVVKHPSAQVEEYVKSCKERHSAITEYSGDGKVTVKGRVFFPCMDNETLDTYRANPNHNLVKEYPVFNSTEELKNDLLQFIDAPDPDFAEKFSLGCYAQGTDLKSWAENALRTFMNDGEAEKPFTLLDSQDEAYNEIFKELQKSIQDTSGEKKVFIIEGEPGSGKTAVAINLLLDALKETQKLPDQKYRRNILFASSSTNEKTWENTFSENKCKDLIAGTSMFNPGVSSTNKNEIAWNVREKHPDMDLFEEELTNQGELVFKRSRWRDVWKLIREGDVDECRFGDHPCHIENNMYFLTIADEAHSQVACYNEDTGEDIVFTSKGWIESIGPQAFYVMYTSQITLFLMEDKQGFTDKEATRVEGIKKLAKNDLGVKDENIKHFKLTEQYRCGHSSDYINWVEKLLHQNVDAQIEYPYETDDNKTWFKDKNGEKTFSVQITDYPSDMETILRGYLETEKASMRLLSSYSVYWKSNCDLYNTKGISPEAKQNLPPKCKDFYLEDRNGTYWSRVWNTKDQFVMPINNREMQKDPLCEVGYPQEIRGWDFNYFGILWLDDLLWRDGKWGIRVKMDEKNPFRGSKSKGKLNTWEGPIWDAGISTTRKNAEIELENKIKKLKADVNDLKKELKNAGATLKKNEKALRNNPAMASIVKENHIRIAELEARYKESLEAFEKFSNMTVCFESEDLPCVNKLFEAQFRIYRILLTRALKGNVIYVKDPETREHLRELLK